MESHLGLLNCSFLLKHDFVHGVVVFAKFYKPLKKSTQFPGIVYICTVWYWIYIDTGQYGQYGPMGPLAQFIGLSGGQAIKRTGREGSRWAGWSGGRGLVVEGVGGWEVGYRDGVWILVWIPREFLCEFWAVFRAGGFGVILRAPNTFCPLNFTHG